MLLGCAKDGKVSVQADMGRFARVLSIILVCKILIDFSLTVKAATLIFISGRSLAISSAKEGKSGFIYNLVKS